MCDIVVAACAIYIFTGSQLQLPTAQFWDSMAASGSDSASDNGVNPSEYVLDDPYFEFPQLPPIDHSKAVPAADDTSTPAGMVAPVAIPMAAPVAQFVSATGITVTYTPKAASGSGPIPTTPNIFAPSGQATAAPPVPSKTMPAGAAGAPLVPHQPRGPPPKRMPPPETRHHPQLNNILGPLVGTHRTGWRPCKPPPAIYPKLPIVSPETGSRSRSRSPTPTAPSA